MNAFETPAFLFVASKLSSVKWFVRWLNTISSTHTHTHSTIMKLSTPNHLSKATAVHISKFQERMNLFPTRLPRLILLNRQPKILHRIFQFQFHFVTGDIAHGSSHRGHLFFYSHSFSYLFYWRSRVIRACNIKGSKLCLTLVIY